MKTEEQILDEASQAIHTLYIKMLSQCDNNHPATVISAAVQVILDMVDYMDDDSFTVETAGLIQALSKEILTISGPEPTNEAPATIQ